MPESEARGEATRLSVVLLGAGDCEVRHEPTGARLRTSKPPAYGGSGSSFSSTDLLAAALGTCIATDLEALFERHGIGLDEVRIEVERVLSTRPKRLEALHVRLGVRGVLEERTKIVIQRAAEHCVVRRSLAPEVGVSVKVESRPDAQSEAGSDA